MQPPALPPALPSRAPRTATPKAPPALPTPKRTRPIDARRAAKRDSEPEPEPEPEPQLQPQQPEERTPLLHDAKTAGLRQPPPLAKSRASASRRRSRRDWRGELDALKRQLKQAADADEFSRLPPLSRQILVIQRTSLSFPLKTREKMWKFPPFWG